MSLKSESLKKYIYNVGSKLVKNQWSDSEIFDVSWITYNLYGIFFLFFSSILTTPSGHTKRLQIWPAGKSINA